MTKHIDSINGDLELDKKFWDLDIVKRLKEKGYSDGQIIRLFRASKIIGSIKTSYPIDSEQIINELRGKSKGEHDEDLQ